MKKGRRSILSFTLCKRQMLKKRAEAYPAAEEDSGSHTDVPSVPPDSRARRHASVRPGLIGQWCRRARRGSMSTCLSTPPQHTVVLASCNLEVVAALPRRAGCDVSYDRSETRVPTHRAPHRHRCAARARAPLRSLVRRGPVSAARLHRTRSRTGAARRGCADLSGNTRRRIPYN